MSVLSDGPQLSGAGDQPPSKCGSQGGRDRAPGQEPSSVLRGYEMSLWMCVFLIRHYFKNALPIMNANRFLVSGNPKLKEVFVEQHLNFLVRVTQEGLSTE